MLEDHPHLYLTKKDKPFVFRDLAGFTPGISRLVFMLDFARRSTLGNVRGLSISQFDTQVMRQGNTLGTLLAHIAEVEQTYQAVTFRGFHPALSEDESVLSEAGRKRFRGYDLQYYLEHLRAVRTETLKELSHRDDAWLYHEYAPWPNGTLMNNLFCWFHVAEDELNHGGQMRILRKELKFASKT